MKHAVSVSLGSSSRNKHVIVDLKGQTISLERIGFDGDVAAARRKFAELDGKVDVLGVGGVDLNLYLDERKYPLHAAWELVKDVHQTPIVDGSGLKHTLERRVFELAAPALGDIPRFHKAFVTMAVDRPGLAHAVADVADEVIFGDFMFGLDLPLPLKGLRQLRMALRIMLPFVSHFPMSMIFYGSSGKEYTPKFTPYWQAADLIAGDFLFMKKYMPEDLSGKTVVTNTTTAENVESLRKRGVTRLITTTPRYEGRSFGTNMMEAALTAYAGLGRVLTRDELNALIDELGLRSTVEVLNP
jgi:hypothetical protein